MAMPPGDVICVTMTYFKIYIATDINTVEYIKKWILQMRKSWVRYSLMRNQHLEFHDPNMHGSKDVGVFIQSVTGGQKGSQNNNGPLIF